MRSDTSRFLPRVLAMSPTVPQEPSPVQPSAEHHDPAEPSPTFGWTVYAEQINGRFAMIGFTALLLIEVLTHQDFLTWLNLW
jgi:Chlorophyll A-B binding protein